VGLDGRALGNINRYRGIGHYTANLVENLVRVGGDLQFVLFAYGKARDCDLLHQDTLEKLEWREIPETGNLSYISLLREHLLFAKVIDDSGLDIFHAMDHNMTPFLHCPSLVTVHDLILLVLRGPYLGPTAWLWMQAHRRAAERASMIVAVSHNTAWDVERIWGIPAQRITVVHEGVGEEYRPVADDVIEDAAARYGIKRHYFLYLGGFDPRKNIYNMLLSFKRFLLKGGTPFQLILCGDARGFEGYLNDTIAELGLNSNVVLTGFVDKDYLPALYTGATAFICVSLYEGFGLPLLEAMACATPVIASRSSSLPEVVGDAGILVDPLLPSEIASGLQRLAYDREASKMLSQRARTRSLEFRWEKTALAILGLYEEAAMGGGGS
jgi:glycosyltransferase involved in cell wall biosynthesis